MCRIPDSQYCVSRIAGICVTGDGGEHRYRRVLRVPILLFRKRLQSTSRRQHKWRLCTYFSAWTNTSVWARRTYTPTLSPSEDTVLSGMALYSVSLCTYISAWEIQVSRHVRLIHQYCHWPRIRPLVDWHRNTGTGRFIVEYCNTNVDAIVLSGKSPTSTPLMFII